MALTMADIEKAINLSSSDDDDDLPDFRSAGKAKAAPKKKRTGGSSSPAASSAPAKASSSTSRYATASPRRAKASSSSRASPSSTLGIPDIHSQAAAEVDGEDFDLPDWRTGDYGRGGKVTKKAAPKKNWSGSTSTSGQKPSIREQLKKGMVPQVSARSRRGEDSEEDEQRSSKDVVERLTAGTGLRSRQEDAVKKSFRKVDMGADDPSTFDTTEYEGDLVEENADLDYAEVTAEEEAAMRREVEAELAGDSFGLPDWKNGKFRNKNTKAAAAIQPVKKQDDGKIKNLRQQFKEGKVALSAREQVAAAEAERKRRTCVINGCDDLAVDKRRYCAKHHNMQQYNPDMLRKAAENIKAQAQADKPLPERTCSRCGRDMTGQQMVEALGRLWHPKCFSCTKCKKSFPGGRFVTLNGNPYCRPCAQVKQQAGSGASGAGQGRKTCAGCKTSIGERGVVALEQHWHPKCFVCTHCTKQFPGGRFVSVKNKPYCNNTCFEESIGL